MKKIISLVAVFAIILASSLCAFADYGTITVPEDVRLLEVNSDKLYEVSVEDLNADYATIVAVKGTTIQVGAIQYINQAPTTEGAASFAFALNDELVEKADVEDTKVYVLTGGDGKIRVAGYIETAPQTPEEPEVPELPQITISGNVSSNMGSTGTIVVKLFNNSDDITTAEPVATTGADVNGDFTLTVNAPADATAYKLVVSKPTYLSYLTSDIAVDTADIDAKILFGDFDANNEVGFGEVGEMLVNYKKTSEDDDFNAIYDPDENNEVGFGEVGTILINYKSTFADVIK